MNAFGLLLIALLQGQTEAPSAEPVQQKKIKLDFSDQYKMLSEDLEKSLRFKHLFRIFGVSEVHIYPAREAGPYFGPPLKLWGNGWSTSLWRDPVTGWPLQ